jgi:dolichol-phosphate mannosyltransferase
MLSIVIPTLNEEKNIEKTLLKIEKISKIINLDVIIVDDNSNDKTIELANLFKNKLDIKIIRNKKNLGLGYALTRGYNSSNSSYVMFLDADLSISEYDILNLIYSKKDNGIVIGSRYLTGSKIIGANKKKVFLSYFLNLIVSKIFKLKVIDISHSFRIISKRITIKSKNLSHPGFFWEMTINAKQDNFIINEIPITFQERFFGSSKNKSLLMLISVIKSLINIIK